MFILLFFQILIPKVFTASQKKHYCCTPFGIDCNDSLICIIFCSLKDVYFQENSTLGYQ